MTQFCSLYCKSALQRTLISNSLQMPNDEPLELEALASTLQARKQASPSTDIVQQARSRVRISPLFPFRGLQFERIREVLEATAFEMAISKNTKVSARKVFLRVMHQISIMESQPPSRPLHLDQCLPALTLPNSPENAKKRLFKLRKVETCHDLSRVGIDPPTDTDQPHGSAKDKDYDDGGEVFSSASSSASTCVALAIEFKDMEDKFADCENF